MLHTEWPPLPQCSWAHSNKNPFSLDRIFQISIPRACFAGFFCTAVSQTVQCHWLYHPFFSPHPNQFISTFHQSCFIRPSPVSSREIQGTDAPYLLHTVQSCHCPCASGDSLRSWGGCPWTTRGCLRCFWMYPPPERDTPPLLGSSDKTAFPQHCTQVSSAAPSSLQTLLGKNHLSQLADGKQTLIL